MLRKPTFLFMSLFLMSAGIAAEQSDQLQQQDYSETPFEFIKNQGQFTAPDGMVQDNILYRATKPGVVVCLTRWGLSYFFIKRDKKASLPQKPVANVSGLDRDQAHTGVWERVDMVLEGVTINPDQIVESEYGTTSYNYYYPHCPDGITGLRGVKHFIVKNIYPGIDWEFIAGGVADYAFKTNFIVAPGADYRQIKWKYKGVKEMRTQLMKESVIIKTPLGRLEESVPAAYVDDSDIPVQFTMSGDVFGFGVSPYDDTKPLMIDPNELLWSTHYGLNCTSVSINSDGTFVWATGTTFSNSFPLMDPGGGAWYQGSLATNDDTYILQFDADTKALRWATYYGGSGYDIVNDINSDGSSVYLTGWTDSPDMPTMDPGGGAFYQSARMGFSDIFILRFSSSGVRQWATYYGGTGGQEGTAIFSDGSKVWLTGNTTSTDFPVQTPLGAYTQAYGGGMGDAFVLEFDVASNTRQWSTFYGGTGGDNGLDIASDGTSLWVAGFTSSTDMPTLDAAGGAYFQGSNAGNSDIFMLKFDISARTSSWATYYGGSGSEEADAISVNNGSVWITGSTGSTNLPTLNPGGGAYFQGALASADDAYLLRIDATTSAPIYASYLGGTGTDRGYGISADGPWVWVCGWTGSMDFPTINPGSGAYYQGTFSGGFQDAFAARLNASDNSLVWSSYCGGTIDDDGAAISSDGISAWMSGSTMSTDFPLMDAGGTAWYQDTLGNGGDSYLLAFDVPCALQVMATAIDATCGNNNGSATVDSVLYGLPPYIYQWSSGDTSITADSLTSGIYTVTITDSQGCSSFAMVMVNDVNGPTAAIVSTTATNCYGSYDGAADIVVTGGATPYSYLWSNGQTTEDATGLPAGTHEVSVTDASGCTALLSITVNGPASPIIISDSAQSASCGNANGAASAVVSGGTSPYAYQWSNGSTQQTATGLAAGVYGLTVTDINGCMDSSWVAVSNTGTLVITVDSLWHSTCTAGGAVFVTVNGGTSPYSYQWSNGATTEDVSGLMPGTYNISASDMGGCMATASVDLEQAVPDTFPLCLVTVDTVTGTNLIVWDKSTVQGIDHFNLYKESSTANLYYLIASVPYDSLSLYVDTVSNPIIHSWRYKMTSVDSCGTESPYSPVHKTIHLVISQFGGNNYLMWDAYEGFTYPKFYIWRQNGAYQWSLIDSIASNLFSYTDPLPPSGTRTYFVEVKSPSTCFAARSLSYNSSRSNRSENLSNTSVAPAVNNGHWILYPNPTTGLLTIRSPFALDPSEFYVYDLMGREVEVPEIQKSRSETQFDMSHLSDGVYFIRVGGQVGKVVLFK